MNTTSAKYSGRESEPCTVLSVGRYSTCIERHTEITPATEVSPRNKEMSWVPTGWMEQCKTQHMCPQYTAEGLCKVSLRSDSAGRINYTCRRKFPLKMRKRDGYLLDARNSVKPGTCAHSIMPEGCAKFHCDLPMPAGENTPASIGCFYPATLCFRPAKY